MLRRFGGHSRQEAPERHVTLYTKHGCHLCEQAEELLDDLRAEYHLQITAFDITSDVTLFERYKYEIPVIVVEGGGQIAGRIDRESLHRLLKHPAPKGAGKGTGSA